MTTFYLTRHGETLWNRERRMQGHMNSDLTEDGIAQAKALGKYLMDQKINSIYSSASGRTLQTSGLINEALHLDIIPKKELMEIHLGHWEGKTKEEIEAFDAMEYYHFWQEPQNFRPKSGEHFYDVSRRALTALEQIAQFHKGDTVLVVSHAVVLKSLLMVFNQTELSHFWSGTHMLPTCLTKVTYDQGQWQIDYIGRTDHYALIEA